MGQMAAIGVAPVQESDQARAISTIVSAFTDDPVERWLYPELEQYLTHFADFVAAFGGEAFSDQTVWPFSGRGLVSAGRRAGRRQDCQRA
jgi:hypothetical protein